MDKTYVGQQTECLLFHICRISKYNREMNRQKIKQKSHIVVYYLRSII